MIKRKKVPIYELRVYAQKCIMNDMALNWGPQNWDNDAGQEEKEDVLM
jgi:hypothetical protein